MGNKIAFMGVGAVAFGAFGGTRTSNTAPG